MASGWIAVTWTHPDGSVIEHQVMPINDLREHEDNEDCWCGPTEDEDEPNLWVHHAMDRREEYEAGRPLN